MPGAHSAVKPQMVGSSPYTKAEPPKKKDHRVAIIIVVFVLLALIAIGVFAGVNANAFMNSVQQVRTKAQALMPAADSLVSAVKDGRTQDIQMSAQTLIDGVAEIRSETDSSLWQLAEKVPVYGEDVRAGRELVAAADDAMKSILTPALPTLINYPKQSLYGGGALNGEAIKAYSNLGMSLSLAVDQLSNRVNAIHAPNIDQINELVTQVGEPLDTASSLLDEVAPYLSNLPNILGCYSDRTYLVIAQNPSEIRSTGGYFGAMAPVMIHNGSVSVGNINGVQVFEENAAYTYTDLSYEEGGLFDSMGVHIGNLAAIADFSQAATAVNKLWTNGVGMSFDGIIALDPTVLQDLVGMFGDVTLSNGMTLTGTNTAKAILHDTYQYYSQNEDQDLVFAEAAYAILDKIMDASLDNFDASKLLDIIKTCMDERRLLVWMSNPTEQALMDELGCTGRLFEDPTTPVVGIYLNDSTWSKFAWWLTSSTVVGEGVPNADGTMTYQVTTVIGNAATWEEVYNSNRYVTGYNGEKRDVGDMITTVYIFAPAGGYISDAWISEYTDVVYSAYHDRPAIFAIIHNEPGETTAINYYVTVSAQAQQPLATFTTPTAEKARTQSY